MWTFKREGKSHADRCTGVRRSIQDKMATGSVPSFVNRRFMWKLCLGAETPPLDVSPLMGKKLSFEFYGRVGVDV